MNNITARYRYATFCLAGLLVFILGGCLGLGTVKEKTTAAYKATTRATQKTARKMGQIVRLDFATDKLKRKVGMAVVKENPALPDAGIALENGMTGVLGRRCDRVLIVKPGDSGFPDYLEAPPRRPDGRVANFEFAKAAKPSGFNALITASVVALRINEEPRGLLWMKETVRFVEVVVAMEVLDTQTAAKLLDETMIGEIFIDKPAEDAPLPSLDGLRPAIEAKLSEMGAEMADLACEAISGRPWVAFVTGLRDAQMVVSAGTMSGLTVNQVLDVMDSGDIVEGFEGERFVIPGKKSGRIKIVAVYPDMAEAVSLSGQVTGAGSVVKLPD